MTSGVQVRAGKTAGNADASSTTLPWAAAPTTGHLWAFASAVCPLDLLTFPRHAAFKTQTKHQDCHEILRVLHLPHRACRPSPSSPSTFHLYCEPFHSCPSDLAPRVYPSATTLRQQTWMCILTPSLLGVRHWATTYSLPPVSLQVGAATWQGV